MIKIKYYVEPNQREYSVVTFLQNGDECWCGNTYHRAYEENAVCNIACPGAPAQLCGGDMASSIYKVNRGEWGLQFIYEKGNSLMLLHNSCALFYFIITSAGRL